MFVLLTFMECESYTWAMETEADMANTEKSLEVAFVLEGERKPQIIEAPEGATVGELLALVAARHGVDIDEVAIEDSEEILDLKTQLRDVLVGAFKVLHLGKRGKVKVDVTFERSTVHEDFRPAATMRKVTRWAIAALGLEGEVADFQLKLGDDVLPPETHVGQVAKGAKVLHLTLVMKIKPQG